MMNAAALRIGFGEDDPIPGDAVDGPDMLVIVADDLHMLADLSQQTALLLPPLAPAAEVTLEPRLVLPAVFIIVAVQIAHVPLSPAMVVRVIFAAAIGRSGEAAATEFVAARGFALAPATTTLDVLAPEAAGGEELLGAAAVIARHRPVAAFALAVEIALASTL